MISTGNIEKAYREPLRLAWMDPKDYTMEDLEKIIENKRWALQFDITHDTGFGRSLEYIESTLKKVHALEERIKNKDYKNNTPLAKGSK